MQLDWMTIFIIQVCIWSIVLYDWKRLKKAPKTDKITVSVILMLSIILSFINLENMPGPITVLRYLFDPLAKIMQ
ncbi:hypothetical protein H9635_17385 [Solibacillus sp. A46]|uniref:Uncharacterized protein n=1 Tax=Solibacillus faecavium TaxID=2762221 RepID=A0ABR8Y2S6_9BACL|nr:hypothetical protein [Solibacillus faecavium]MBD8038521.1 hypothetical protein [Solibacillus faecavium]